MTSIAPAEPAPPTHAPPDDPDAAPTGPIAAALLLYSLCIVLFELLLTRIFAVTLFAQFAQLALALALLGISAGATAQHLWPSLMPAVGLRRRLGLAGIALALTTLGATLAALYLPVLDLPKEIPDTYQDTSFIRDQLLRTPVFILLMLILTVPFTCAGLAFAGTFQRRKEQIGTLYAADLVGGAVGAAMFLPALMSLAGPDVVFVILGLAGLGAAIVAGPGGVRVVGVTLAGLGLVASLAGLTRELLPIRATAGFSDRLVTYIEWTPLTRLAVFEDPNQVLVLLDNSSASEVPINEARRNKLRSQINRSLVYRLHPPGHVAILAASAGPEVATAQTYGWSDIDAIDIAGEIFEIVATRFPDSPTNPYLQPGVRRVTMDGRSAILGATGQYDVIQMVHANLWSAAGLLANTWSPALLETREAFATYLDHLAPDGILSFGRGSETDTLVRAAAAALTDRGVTHPWRHIAYVRGNGTVALIRGRPWTDAEALALSDAVASYTNQRLDWDVRAEGIPAAYKRLAGGPVMTDDRPYVDTLKSVSGALANVWEGKPDTPLAALYRSVLAQLGLAAVAGLVLVGLPWVWRGRSESAGIRGRRWVLGYVAAIGYGYLAVETVLIHDLVLFVGHPTYAITTVVLTLLVASGVGSFLVHAWPAATLLRRLQLALAAVIGLGVLIGPVAAPLLTQHLLGLPIAARVALTAGMLAPLGLVMGVPYPASIRILRPDVAGIVPWAWAVNGWMSVVASLATVLLARLWGYQPALGVALGAYTVALLTAGRLHRVTRAPTQGSAS